MTGKTHASFAIALMPVFQIQTAGPIAGIFIGSLFPDFDSSGSTIGRRFHVPGLKHRGISHTPLLGFAIAILIYAVFYFFKISCCPEMNTAGMNFAVWFFVGYLSHLFLDMLTPMGVPFFYPLYKRRVHLAKIPTNSLIEHLIFIGLWVVIILFERQFFMKMI